MGKTLDQRVVDDHDETRATLAATTAALVKAMADNASLQPPKASWSIDMRSFFIGCVLGFFAVWVWSQRGGGGY